AAIHRRRRRPNTAKSTTNSRIQKRGMRKKKGKNTNPGPWTKAVVAAVASMITPSEDGPMRPDRTVTSTIRRTACRRVRRADAPRLLRPAYAFGTDGRRRTRPDVPKAYGERYASRQPGRTRPVS